jgi:ABC-type nitrate/sulfonate/bicarbonate transport system substrate-binding protein
LVRRFVRASQQGWRYAVEHPDEAAQILLKWAPKPGLKFQKLAVRAVGPLVDTPQAPVGWIDSARWRQLMGATYNPARPGYTMSFAASER